MAEACNIVARATAESSPSARARATASAPYSIARSLSCTMPTSPPHASARIRRLGSVGSPSESAAVIHRQVSSMRPPMFQNQPSPPAMAHAMSASPDSTAHSIARRMSSSSSPTVRVPVSLCRPVRRVRDLDQLRDVRGVPSAGRRRVTRSLELFAAVLRERLKQPELDGARDLRCRHERLVDQPGQQLGDVVLLDRLVGADRFRRRYPEAPRKERKGARTRGVRRRTAGRSSSRSRHAASADAGTRYVLRRSTAGTGRRACSRDHRARTRASGPRRARSRAEGNRGAHRARGPSRATASVASNEGAIGACALR